MINEFMSLEILATFTGLVVAVGVIVQFTKSMIKGNFDDVAVRVYTLVISLILTFVFARTGTGLENIILTIINSIIVAVSTMGAYEVITDPKAEKRK